MVNIHSFDLDIKRSALSVVRVVNGDDLNKLHITIKSLGNSQALTGLKVQLVIRRSDGVVVTLDSFTGDTPAIAITGNANPGRIEVTLNNGCFRPGKNDAEVQIIDSNDKILTTARFVIDARQELLTPEAAQASPSIPILQQIMDAWTTNATVSATTLPAGSDATVTLTYDENNNIVALAFGIPQGPQGDSFWSELSDAIAPDENIDLNDHSITGGDASGLTARYNACALDFVTIPDGTDIPLSDLLGILCRWYHEIDGKQDELTAGDGISISGNVISATGGGGGGGDSHWSSVRDAIAPDDDIDLNSYSISGGDASGLTAERNSSFVFADIPNGTPVPLSELLARLAGWYGEINGKQAALTAGTGISIVNNVISATGGGSATGTIEFVTTLPTTLATIQAIIAAGNIPALVAQNRIYYLQKEATVAGNTIISFVAYDNGVFYTRMVGPDAYGSVDTVEPVQRRFYTTTLTIAVADWESDGNNGYEATKSVTGMTATALVWVEHSVTNPVITAAQDDGELTFSAPSVPSEADTVKVGWLV